MKHILILTALYTWVVMSAQSQSTTSKGELQLYITAGMKFLQPKYFGHATNISPASVPTLGSGALWQMKKFQLGGEFNYADGKKQTSEFGTIFTGINFALLGGYTWSLGKKLTFGVQTGFGYSLYHLSLTDKNYNGSANLNTAIYHNFIYTIPVSGVLQRVNTNGTFFGLRAGYHFNSMPNEWRYIEGATTEVFPADTDGFYFHVVFGGLLKLKQSHP